jgi:hypothetical protein
MKRVLLPLVLGFAASAAIACPGADKSADAKSNAATAAHSAQPAATQVNKAEADKKVAKRLDAKKPTT